MEVVRRRNTRQILFCYPFWLSISVDPSTFTDIFGLKVS